MIYARVHDANLIEDKLEGPIMIFEYIEIPRFPKPPTSYSK